MKAESLGAVFMIKVLTVDISSLRFGQGQCIELPIGNMRPIKKVDTSAMSNHLLRVWTRHPG